MSGSTRFRRRFRTNIRTRFREASALSQFTFNRVLEKVSEKVWEALVQSQVRFNRVPQNIPEKVPGSGGAKPSQVQRVRGKVGETNAGEVHLTHGNLAEEFPALGFPARFRKIDKNKTLRLLGIPPKVFWGQFAPKNGPGLQKLLASTVPGELSASRQIRKNANTRSYREQKTNTRLITGKKLQTQLCLVNIFFHFRVNLLGRSILGLKMHVCDA